MKKKGSAIVMAVLLLAFFMAITLNMYFITRKKGQRAVAKIKGTRITSFIDSGSSYGYYELSQADYYVTKGYLYNDGKDITSGSFIYPETNGGTLEPEFRAFYDTTGNRTVTYAGISLNNYNEYFASSVEKPTGTSVGAILVSEEITTDGSINSRNWENNTPYIKRLWELPLGTKSVGGYELKRYTKGTEAEKEYTGSLISEINDEENWKFTYEKEFNLSATDLPDVKFKAVYKEEITISAGVITADQGTELKLEKLKAD